MINAIKNGEPRNKQEFDKYIIQGSCIIISIRIHFSGIYLVIISYKFYAFFSDRRHNVNFISIFFEVGDLCIFPIPIQNLNAPLKSHETLKMRTSLNKATVCITGILLKLIFCSSFQFPWVKAFRPVVVR